MRRSIDITGSGTSGIGRSLDGFNYALSLLLLNPTVYSLPRIIAGLCNVEPWYGGVVVR